MRCAATPLRIVGCDGLGEESSRLTCVATKEFDDEEAHAELPMAFDAFDDTLGGSPDSVLFDRTAHMTAVDFFRFLEGGTRGLIILGDHDGALL